MADAGRLLVLAGLVLVVVGGALTLFGRFHLPGDFTFRAGSATVYIPIATGLILSVVLTVVLSFLFRQR